MFMNTLLTFPRKSLEETHLVFITNNKFTTKWQTKIIKDFLSYNGDYVSAIPSDSSEWHGSEDVNMMTLYNLRWE